MILPSIETPADLRPLGYDQLSELAAEIRAFIVESVTTTGGHLGSNLGVVELTLALHRVFDSPHDVILWDTGHQAYVHKILTGRRHALSTSARRAACRATRTGRSPTTTGSRTATPRPCSPTPTGWRPPTSLGRADRQRRRPQGGRRHRRRVDDGRHGLRGAQQPRPFGPPGRDRAERQRPLLRPTISQLSESLTSLRLNPALCSPASGSARRAPEHPGTGRLAAHRASSA